MMKTSKYTALLLLMITMLASCYHRPHRYANITGEITGVQTDTMSFYTLHHYTVNYNFIVRSDSLTLVAQQPEEVLSNMPTDSFTVWHDEHLVVADYRTLPQDPADSVWIQVATASRHFGWVHEGKLLHSVVPDDPISEFISTFSDTHLLIFLIVICVISAAYLIRKLKRMDVHRPLPRHPFLLSHSAHATGGVGSDTLCQHPDICPRRMAALLLQPDTQPAVGATHTGAISASGLGDADCKCRSAGRRARSVGNGRSHTLSEWTGCSLRHRLHSLQHHLFIFYRLYSARIVFHIRHQAIPHP